MALPVIPLWAKLAALWIGKKGLILVAAKVYGIPRLYRKSQHAVRYLYKEGPARRAAFKRVQGAYRIPDKLLHGWWTRKPVRSPPSTGEPGALKSSPPRTHFTASFASAPLLEGDSRAKGADLSLRARAQSAVLALSPGKLGAAGCGGVILGPSRLFSAKSSMPGLQRSLITRGAEMGRR